MSVLAIYRQLIALRFSQTWAAVPENPGRAIVERLLSAVFVTW